MYSNCNIIIIGDDIYDDDCDDFSFLDFDGDAAGSLRDNNRLLRRESHYTTLECVF